MMAGIVSGGRIPVASAAPLAIGDPYGGGYYAGDISYSGKNYHIVVAAKTAEIQAAYRSTYPAPAGMDSATDGFANTAKMVELGVSDYPAGEHCHGHSGGGFFDWYMPAISELALLFTNLNPNAAGTPAIFKTGGSQAIYHATTTPLFSSTRVDGFSVKSLRFIDGGGIDEDPTYANRYVRPIRRIEY